MRVRSIIALFCLLLAPHLAQAQSVAMGVPVIDAQGFVAFEVREILRIEGNWEKPLVLGEWIYPLRRAKAHPIGRFGEAVVMKFPTPDNRSNWEGMNVHNGCIPALHGMTQGELKTIIAKLPNPKLPKPAPTGSAKSTKTHTTGYGICPICKQRHVRL